ncbi:MAG: hypothetical protein ACK56F_08690, partial [bacterium]
GSIPVSLNRFKITDSIKQRFLIELNKLLCSLCPDCVVARDVAPVVDEIEHSLKDPGCRIQRPQQEHHIPVVDERLLDLHHLAWRIPVFPQRLQIYFQILNFKNPDPYCNRYN